MEDPLAFTNKNVPALWLRFYLLACSHMQSKHDTLGVEEGVSASAAMHRQVQPGVGEDYWSHGLGTWQQWGPGGIMLDTQKR